MDRRTLLAALASLGTVAAAGCTGGGADRPTDSPTATPTRSPTPTATPTATSTPTAGTTPTPEPAVSVDVGPGGSLRFEPASFAVGVGDTVAWAFRSRGHNVKPDAVPEGAGWAGTSGGAFDTLPVGFVHRHTFEIPGTYDYFCAPHRSAGMVGSFDVEG